MLHRNAVLEVLSCCTVTGNLRGGRDHDQKDEKGDHSNNDKKEEARKPVTKRKMTSRLLNKDAQKIHPSYSRKGQRRTRPLNSREGFDKGTPTLNTLV